MALRRDEIEARLRTSFEEEATKDLALLDNLMNALSEGFSPAEVVEHLEKMCRLIHMLKGAAGTVGLTRIAEVCHQAESWLETFMADGDPMDRQSIMTLRELIDSIKKTYGEGHHELYSAWCPQKPGASDEIPRED